MIFLQIGLILTLSTILFAFEWKTSLELEKFNGSKMEWKDVEDYPPPTMPKEEIPKKVEPPSFELKIVDDLNEDVIDDLSHLISEIEETDELRIVEIEDYRDEDVYDEPFIRVEFMPTFQEKDSKYFRNYISKKVKFPSSAVEHGIKGTVFASFIVDKDGTVTNTEIVRGVHPIIDKAVIDAIEDSPKWEPGINNGKFVKVKFTIAIKFDLI